MQPEIKIYENLRDSYEIINAWADPDLLPVSKSATADLDSLNELMVVELIFDGAKGDRNKFDLIFRNVYSFIGNIIVELGKPAYIFTSEHKAQIQNRIRTYKGVLPKSFKGPKSHEYELLLPRTYSIIGALVLLDKINFSEASDIDLFTGSATSFIILSSKTSFFLPTTIEYILSNFMTHKSRSWLNYVKLISFYCMQGDIIIRIGGDGGDRYVSIQIFCSKSEKEFVIKALNKF